MAVCLDCWLSGYGSNAVQGPRGYLHRQLLCSGCRSGHPRPAEHVAKKPHHIDVNSNSTRQRLAGCFPTTTPKLPNRNITGRSPAEPSRTSSFRGLSEPFSDLLLKWRDSCLWVAMSALLLRTASIFDYPLPLPKAEAVGSGEKTMLPKRRPRGSSCGLPSLLSPVGR